MARHRNVRMLAPRIKKPAYRHWRMGRDSCFWGAAVMVAKVTVVCREHDLRVRFCWIWGFYDGPENRTLHFFRPTRLQYRYDVHVRIEWIVFRDISIPSSFERFDSIHSIIDRRWVTLPPTLRMVYGKTGIWEDCHCRKDTRCHPHIFPADSKGTKPNSQSTPELPLRPTIVSDCFTKSLNMKSCTIITMRLLSVVLLLLWPADDASACQQPFVTILV